MQGKPGLAGRIFTAISRERVNLSTIQTKDRESEKPETFVGEREGREKKATMHGFNEGGRACKMVKPNCALH